jgi:hypothetical protein
MAFNKLLSGNQYPQEVIRQTYNSHRQRRQQTNTNESPLYLKVPFINDEVNRRLHRVFRRHGIRARFHYSNQSLRQILLISADRDPIDLRLKEAILIKDQDPKINSREEMLWISNLIW